MLINEIPDNEIQNLLNEMFYELLIKHKKGEIYQKVLIQTLCRSVFIFGKDSHLSAGIEGRNEFIREMFNCANRFMTEKPKDNKVKNVKRELKKVVNDD